MSFSVSYCNAVNMCFIYFEVRVYLPGDLRGGGQTGCFGTFFKYVICLNLLCNGLGILEVP